jgi:hypothetical protein
VKWENGDRLSSPHTWMLGWIVREVVVDGEALN